MIFGGDGIFLAILTGPGTVWLQTLPISRLAHQISEYLPRGEGSGVGTPPGGALLGGIVGSILGAGTTTGKREITRLSINSRNSAPEYSCWFEEIRCMSQTDGKRRDLRGDIAFAFGLALACYVAWLLRHVLLLLYVSALPAVVLRPIVRAISTVRIGRWRPFRGNAILILLLAVAGALTAFGFLALPPVIHDLQEFGKEAPTRLPRSWTS